MPRVCVPQGAVAGFRDPHTGQLYKARNGIMDVPDHIAHDLVKLNDCFPASAVNRPRGSRGFVCTGCGFHGYFRTCGHCGCECIRPEETAHAQEADC